MMIPGQIVSSTEAAEDAAGESKATIWSVMLGMLLGVIGAFLLAWLCGTPLPF
jgi:hypothetical protein